MTQDDLRDLGLNKSGTHVDFMIGADDLDIMGVTADGEEIPVFVNGQWTGSRRLPEMSGSTTKSRVYVRQRVTSSISETFGLMRGRGN